MICVSKFVKEFRLAEMTSAGAHEYFWCPVLDRYENGGLFEDNTTSCVLCMVVHFIFQRPTERGNVSNFLPKDMY